MTLSVSDITPLIINGSFLAQPATGVQRFAVEISRRLLALHPNAELVAPRNLRSSEATAALAPRIIGRFTGHLWEQLDLWWYARRRRALLLNLDLRGPLLYRRKIITIHDLNFLHNPRWVSRRFYYFYRSLVCLGSRTSQHIITVSRFSQQEIGRYLNVPTDRTTVVYNAVSPIRPATGKRTVEKPYVLSVASTDPRKNLDRLVRAFLYLNRPDLQLVLVGLPHRRGTTIEANDPRVVFLGYVDESVLVSLYQHAEAFVYPSLYEGFGIPPLEAMQYGCPTVVAHSSSLPEICADATYYVDPASEQSIAEGIQRVLDEPELRQTLIRRGRHQVQKFDWERSAQKLYEVLLS